VNLDLITTIEGTHGHRIERMKVTFYGVGLLREYMAKGVISRAVSLQ
jgi:hypothetical protein